VSIKLERRCNRCRREDPQVLTSAMEVVEAEEHGRKREETARKIEEYLATIPRELMPDLIVFVKGEGAVHRHLCSPADAKRSCLQRVLDLAGAMKELEERKPARKKRTTMEAAA